MDAIDNPSYFSLPNESQKKFRSNFLRRWNESRSSATLPANAVTKKNTSSSGAKRNFRSLMRANSEDAQLLVQGKPRPTDLAPSVYSIKHQRHRSIGNVIGSNDLLHQDMVHCGGVNNNDDGDVFLPDSTNTTSPQYYNVLGPSAQRVLTPGRRRHSIGSFLSRDRSFSASGDDTRSKESSNRKKFKRITIEKASKMEDELDILLVSCGESETSTKWSNYLVTCFQSISKERNIPSFKLQSIKLEDILISVIENGTVEKYPEARVQIVIVCQKFLQKILSIPENETSLGKLFRPEKVVALMLGVQDQLENNYIRTVIPKYEQWRKMTVRDVDKSSVEDFLGVAMDILSKSRQLQEALTSEQQQTLFSIMPKKIKVGQNRILVLLNEPLSNKDDIKITIDKNGQRVDVGMIKKRNPYTLQFTVPTSCFQISMLVYVYVEKNGKSLGKRQVKCESRMRELDQMIRTLDNPIHFMCQSFSLNTNDRDQLDTFLCSVFQKNIPPHFNLLNPSILIDKTSTSNEEFPTLLHFTAKYGLEKLSWQLLESPGGEQACQIRNCSHLTPSEIAERANHTKLSKIMRDYTHMTELSNVYNYLKEISSEKEKDAPESNYILPKPVEDTYLIPPAARPIDPSLIPLSMPMIDSLSSPSDPNYTNFKRGNFPSMINSPVSPTSSGMWSPTSTFQNYEVPCNGRPCTPHTPNSPTTPTGKIEGYLDMNSIEKDQHHFGSLSSFNTNNEFPETFGSFPKVDSCEGVSSPTDSLAPSKYGSASHLSSREKLSPEEELLGLIADFKHDVLTINEVESLVKKWQNRNDVQQSFRDRQDQLDRMREEYDRIQRKMKEHMKRTTPFEKIRRFFSRGKAKRLDAHGRANSCDNDVLSGSKPRPYSNISLQSSSSSASSRTNSMSNGSERNVDGVQKQYDRTQLSLEKLNPRRNKLNHYVEIPSVPLSKCADPADNSEYVQPDSMSCNTHTKRLSSCSSSVVNDTIHECVENDNLETYSNSNAKLETRRNTYHSNNVVLKNCKSEDHFRTYSLRFDSKKKSKNVKNKVKSAENLICDYEWMKTNESHANKTAIYSEISEATSKSSGTPSLQFLCAQTIQCLSGLANETEKDEISALPEITFQFDKVVEAAESSTQSECESVDSRHNSSLDLSSLSLNSNCTVDENGDIKCSLEFKITEEGEIETENAPPVASDLQCVNICTALPEYANVTIKNSPSLSRRCGYTVVSS